MEVGIEHERRLATIERNIELNKLQVERLLSNEISERGTLARQGERLRAEIKIVEDRFQKTLYNGEGLSIQVDRLKQQSANLNNIFEDRVSKILDDKLDGILYGDSGVLIRLDRLNQVRIDQNKHNERIYTFLIGIGVTLFCAIILGIFKFFVFH